MNFPESGKITVKALAEADASVKPVFNGIIKGVSVLGFDSEVTYTRDGEGLHISAEGVKSEYPAVFKIEMA